MDNADKIRKGFLEKLNSRDGHKEPKQNRFIHISIVLYTCAWGFTLYICLSGFWLLFLKYKFQVLPCETIISEEIKAIVLSNTFIVYITNCISDFFVLSILPAAKWRKHKVLKIAMLTTAVLITAFYLPKVFELTKYIFGMENIFLQEQLFPKPIYNLLTHIALIFIHLAAFIFLIMGIRQKSKQALSTSDKDDLEPEISR